MFAAARHLFGAAVVRTRWPRGHWSLLVRHGRGAARKLQVRRCLIATPRAGKEGVWLPVWLPQHHRSTHVNGSSKPVGGSDLHKLLARLEGLEPPTF